MIKTKVSLALLTLFFSSSSFALSPEAEEGKTLYPACSVCHATNLEPPKGPPMWGVQRRYKMEFDDDKVFVEKMVAFVKAPSLDTAIHDQGVKSLGLMPPMPLPDSMLQKIATYILEEKFPPPCAHWKIAIKRAEKSGDLQHAEKDRMMLKRFCNGK